MNSPRVLFLSAEDGFVLRTSGIIVDDDGEIVAGEHNRHRLVLYDPKKEIVKVMIVPGIPITYSFLGSSVETLISPNHGGQVMRHCGASSKIISQSSEKEESYEVETSSDSDDTLASRTDEARCSQSSEKEESSEVKTGSESSNDTYASCSSNIYLTSSESSDSDDT